MVVVGVTDSVLGCTRYDTVKVTLYTSPAPVLAANGSTQLCEGDSVTLDAGAAFKSYLWSNGRTDGPSLSAIRAITLSVPRTHSAVTEIPTPSR